jgi:hypothetical protein
MVTVTKLPRWLKTSQVLLAVGMLLGLYSNAVAMRCGTELVNEGDTQYDVAVKCGRPTFVEQNRWIYETGSQTFTEILYFSGGELTLIENGPYGGTGSWPGTQPAAPRKFFREPAAR